MQYKNLFSFNMKWNYKTVSAFIFLIFLPNLLGMINLSTPWGFKLHFFQLAIFIAALIYGPKGGLLSGLIGSIFSAWTMHNPYIIVGNVILGFFVGFFVRLGWHTLLAVLTAYLIQLPWLIITDYYLVSLPFVFIMNLIIALAISNLVWGLLAHYAVKPINNLLKKC